MRGFAEGFVTLVILGFGAWFLSVLIGCGEPEDEAGTAWRCSVDSECDDDNNCTADACTEGGVCVNVYLPSLLCPEEEVESESIYCRVDLDDDGYGGDSVELLGEDCPEGFLPVGSIDEHDCDDRDPAIHPDAEEICDGVDNDCDGVIDEGCIEEEGCEVDTDCSVFDTECLVFRCVAGGCFAGERDDDGDGHSLCGGLPDGERYDCDDSDPDIFPGAEEVYDNVDNDCDGLVDEPPDGSSIYCRVDLDGDGYGGDPVELYREDCPEGFLPLGSIDERDCDDADAEIYPGAEELCDGMDNNCNDTIDEGCGDGRS